MGILLNKVMPDMIRELKIGCEDNIDIKKEIETGLSGAEVYLLELKGSSAYQGSYYLKMEIEENDTRTDLKSIHFTKVAKILEKSKIDNVIITLMQVAGNSSISYKPIFEIDESSVREKAIHKVLPFFLKESIGKVNLLVYKSTLSNIAQRILGSKLNNDRSIVNYLSKVVGVKADLCSISSFYYENETFPNVYKYVRTVYDMDGAIAYDIPCANHGDFHGNNLLYSQKENNYALIDLDLYKEDGFIFYDTAYMELSILLRNMKVLELHKWNTVIKELIQENWHDLDCMDKRVLKAITAEEYKWIETHTKSDFNYKDELIESRYVARMMAGLNFAGKRNVSWEIFQRAFIYACFNLKELFKKRGFNDWRENQIRWHAVLDSHYSEKDDKDCEKLLAEVEYFNSIQKYILIVGDEFKVKVQKIEGLERINWTGIFSFSNGDDLEKWLNRKKLVNVITISGNKMLLDADSVWFVYANGVVYEPENIVENFIDWRNKTRKFLGEISERIQEEIAPNDIEFIVDIDSFSSDGKKRFEKVCEIFDTIDNADMHMSILSKDWFDINEIADICNNIKFDVYHISLDSMAAYCCEYMQGNDVGIRTIPCKNNRQIIIPDELLSNLPSDTELLHSKIIYEEKYMSEKDKYAFLYGEKISWQAIQDHKWIELKTYNRIEKDIVDLIERESSGELYVDVPHSPGAGASVACRVLAWKMRGEYPTVIMYSKQRTIVSFIQKLYSLSGKCILLFLDGDFSYSEVKNIERQMYATVTKVCIIYFHREYNKQYDSIAEKGISRLDSDTAMNFAKVYSERMKFLKGYNKYIITLREKYMNELATHVELIPYRLPFFFGLSAFENDYKGIASYIDHILSDLREDDGIRRIVTYIALTTYYTNRDGLNLSYVKKLIKKYLKKDNISNKTALSILGESKHRIVYFIHGCIKICHPIIAEKIIKMQFDLQSTLFVVFIKEFINDIYACESGTVKSDAQKELLASLFLSRSIEGIVDDNSNEWKKQRFSQLIMDIGNKNQQEQVFKCLTEKFPDNAHFWHHYGRLVIENSPNSLMRAKALFDEAIKLEPENPIHFHARGEMYKKHIKYLCKQTRSDVVELYNLIAVLTDNAIDDYHTSINYIHKSKNKTNDLSLVYPFASLIDISTYVVNQLYRRNKIGVDNEKNFLLIDNKVSNWCKDIIRNAQQIQLQTVIRYDALNRDEFYKNVCAYLVKYKFTPDEIEAQIADKPDNVFLLHSYMYATACKISEWSEKTSAQLKRIKEISGRLILSPKENSEGAMWQWFNASLYDKDTDLSEMKGLLETIPDCVNNMSAQFMLYVIKLGEFLNTGNTALVNEVLEHMKKCRDLSDNSQRKSIRYFYCGDKTVFGFSAKFEDALKVNGTVSQWIGEQNGKIALDKDSRLKAFFVPSAIGMYEDGAVGTKVKFILGVSFDGLRSHSVSRFQV